jgi:glycosyltransferase involved in cell wall biosynthesis
MLNEFLDGLINFYIFCKIIKIYDIFHFSFLGGPLKDTCFKSVEAQLIHFCGGKVIILGYGSDFYVYSRVLNKSWTHTLNVHYPFYAIHEEEVQRQVKYWTKHADIIINGMQIDGLGRWDVLPFRAECIDVEDWRKKTGYSMHDGKNGPVVVVHAPNHRFIKGTEYLIHSIDVLREEGLQVELILIEKKKNTEVKKILEEKADIFFDQLILGYAMSAIEAFSVGLPVITNLENDDYVRVFRRYSYLNECPAMSASHETLTDVLRILVTKPELRKQLGEAGRKYAEKYHSFRTVQELFTKIYDKIWYGKDVGNLNLYYHPLLPDSYNNRYSKIKHPLKENKYVS